MRRLRLYGLELVSLAGGPLSERVAFCGSFRPPYLYIEEYDDAAKAALSASPPFTLGLHPHWFMKVQRVGQVRDRLMRYAKDFPGQHHLRFLPDTAHLTIVDDDVPVVDAIRQIKEHLAAVHLKDWTPSYGRYSHRYAQGFVSLGKGIVDNSAVLALLDEISYEGWIVVEQDTADDTPLESALRCAQWLQQQSRVCVKDRAWVQTYSQPSGLTSPVPPPQRESSLLRIALPAVTRGPAGFYMAVVNAFKQQGDYDGVLLYNFNPTAAELYLVAVAGLERLGCPGIVSTAESILGKVVKSGQVLTFDLKHSDSLSGTAEQAFLAQIPGQRLTAVPVFNASNAHQLHYVLCLLPTSSAPPVTAGELATLAQQIARAADCMADDICSSAATYTSYHCGGAIKKADFINRLFELLKERFDCEGTTILLVDETDTRMEVAQTSGIEWKGDLKPHEQCYHRNTGLTGFVWGSRQMLLTSNAKDHREKEGVGKTLETRSCEQRLSPDRDECLIAPLVRLRGKVLGAIRLLNKRAHAGRRVATMFTDDDAAVLDAIIQSAMPHLEMLTLQERQLNTLARMVHEFQNPLTAIRGYVESIAEELKSANPPVVLSEDYLEDINSWCELMGRLANNARVFSGKPGTSRPQVEKVHFKSDIVAPAVDQARRLLKEKGFRPEAIRYGDFYFMPPLWLDRNQFQQVIFNLLANAVKLANPGELRVNINGYQEGSRFIIQFEDYGPGVEEGLEEMIFLPHFRSERAMRRDVSGQGIGLYVVRSIVEGHGGEITLQHHFRPTRFRIALPEALRHAIPAGSTMKILPGKQHA